MNCLNLSQTSHTVNCLNLSQTSHKLLELIAQFHRVKAKIAELQLKLTKSKMKNSNLACKFSLNSNLNSIKNYCELAPWLQLYRISTEWPAGCFALRLLFWPVERVVSTFHCYIRKVSSSCFYGIYCHLRISFGFAYKPTTQKSVFTAACITYLKVLCGEKAGKFNVLRCFDKTLRNFSPSRSSRQVVGVLV